MATRVFHPVAQTTLVYIRYGTANVRMENVYAYRWSTSSVPSVADLTALCTETGTTLAEKIRQQMSNGISMLEVHARNMDVALGNQATAAFTPGTVGALIGQAAALNAAGNLVKRTGQAGYSSHGGNRLSGFDGLSVNGNTISGTMMGRFASTALSVLAGRHGAQFIPAIAHIPRVGTGTSTPITFAGMLDSDIDSQKTRLNNHGS